MSGPEIIRLVEAHTFRRSLRNHSCLQTTVVQRIAVGALGETHSAGQACSPGDSPTESPTLRKGLSASFKLLQ